VLSHITGALGEEGVGIESVQQSGRGDPGESVPVLVFTHPCQEAAVRRALERVDSLPDVTAPTRLIRIEDDL
jgi:homoserine dehydrogenase